MPAVITSILSCVTYYWPGPAEGAGHRCGKEAGLPGQQAPGPPAFRNTLTSLLSLLSPPSSLLALSVSLSITLSLTLSVSPNVMPCVNGL